MDTPRDPMDKILAEVCRRDQFTCTQCGKTVEHVERYLVLHLVARTREARWPGDYELRCTTCLEQGRHSLCEVVLEHAGGKYAPRTPTRERMYELGKQIIANADSHHIDVMQSIDALILGAADEDDKQLLRMIRKNMEDSEPSPPHG